MRVIRRYEIPIDVDIYTLKVPKGYRILSLKDEDNVAALYCEVSEHRDPIDVTIMVFGTEATIPPGSTLKYIGSVWFYETLLPLHYYYELF